MKYLEVSLGIGDTAYLMRSERIHEVKLEYFVVNNNGVRYTFEDRFGNKYKDITNKTFFVKISDLIKDLKNNVVKFEVEETKRTTKKMNIELDKGE